MYKSLSTAWLAAILLSSVSSCLAKTPQKYFYLQEVGHSINSGHSSGYDAAWITVVDPATEKDMTKTISSSVEYNITIPNSVGGLPSSEWVSKSHVDVWEKKD